MNEEKKDRKEYMAQYYAERKQEIAERRKAARLARRDEINAAERERYATDPNAREQRLNIVARSRKKQKESLATDPEQQKKHEERLAKRRERHKERLADPDYQAKIDAYNAAQREKREKRKARNVLDKTEIK